MVLIVYIDWAGVSVREYRSEEHNQYDWKY
jgi:hypothetical protein